MNEQNNEPAPEAMQSGRELVRLSGDLDPGKGVTREEPALSSRAVLEALKRELAEAHPIPPITDPMGRGWRQPPREEILVDGKHALMGRRTFEALSTYSATFPTGTYPGKMWKRYAPPKDGDPCEGWALLWYDTSPRGPEYCRVESRGILLV